MQLLHSAVLKLKAGIDGFESDLEKVHENRTFVNQGLVLSTVIYFLHLEAYQPPDRHTVHARVRRVCVGVSGAGRAFG